jgi:hypothetical protein
MSNNENQIRSAGKPTEIALPKESKSNRISRHVDEKTVAKSRLMGVEEGAIVGGSPDRIGRSKKVSY